MSPNLRGGGHVDFGADPVGSALVLVSVLETASA